MSAIRTVPGRVEAGEPPLVTGNAYVALPEVRAGDGAVLSATVLHRGLAGLLEWRGRGDLPLVAPEVRLDGRTVRVDWRPQPWPEGPLWALRLAGEAEGHRFLWEIVAPEEARGFALALSARAAGGGARAVELALRWSVASPGYAALRRRPSGAALEARFDGWTGSWVVEARGHGPLLALAFRPEPAGARVEPAGEAVGTAGEAAGAAAEAVLRAAFGPLEEARLRAYVGVGREADGAATTAVHLARRGFAALWREAEEAARARADRASGGRWRSETLAFRAVRNLLFNLHFATGRTIDGEEPVWVTSRSPRYYVAGAHWNRDALLWSLPGLVLADPARAREALLAAWAVYGRNAGEHSLYLDGSLLYPGFELDQLAAFPLATRLYAEATGDEAIWREPQVRERIGEVEARLLAARERGRPLYRTFLNPSDDPVEQPYLTYDLALAAAAWRALAGAREAEGDRAGAFLRRQEAEAILEELRRSAVTAGPFGPMWAWAFDGAGAGQAGDEPAGSLMLLPYYGLVAADDPVQQATARWIHSAANPFGPRGRFPWPRSAHADHPWLLAAISDILAGWEAERRLEEVASARLDGGLACETVREEDGSVATGAAFATCAGWLGYALLRALEGEA
ncbi:MAG: glycoside hydrolase family 125 protein [Bacillota bacterium]|nr:glycoside hydrolase family 125 protein [Bacillota bacterium]